MFDACPPRRTARLATSLLAALAALLALAGCADDTTRGPQRLALVDCPLPGLPVAARCGEIDVPEDRAHPDRRRISIGFAILPANTLAPKADPLIILAGGPGQAATRLGPFAAQLVGVRKERDIVLVDQRGTGRSSPLDCAAFRPTADLDDAFALDPVPKAIACRAELEAKGVDLAQYTTAASVADIDAVREALGYPRVNLWGGSYGTRVALEYLRRHGDRVRSIVLDGVAPPSMRISLDVWATRDAAVSAAIAACLDAPACRAAHPDLDRALERVRAALGEDGRAVAVVDPRTGRSATQALAYAHIVAALQPLTYVPELRALLPEIVSRAAAGDYAPLFAAASLLTADLAEQMNAALHYSVTCAEDASRVGPDDIRTTLAKVREPRLVERVLAVCDVWPRGVQPADATTPVRSDVPALLLSGGLDPVTPAAYAAQVAQTLPGSRHVVAPGFGHIVSPHGCGPRLIAAFVEHGGTDRLPAACIGRFEATSPPASWPNRLGPPA
jgi:pimeloyl-ACP methyl ester carboxylesterase